MLHLKNPPKLGLRHVKVRLKRTEKKRKQLEQEHEGRCPTAPVVIKIPFEHPGTIKLD